MLAALSDSDKSLKLTSCWPQEKSWTRFESPHRRILKPQSQTVTFVQREITSFTDIGRTEAAKETDEHYSHLCTSSRTEENNRLNQELRQLTHLLVQEY